MAGPATSGLEALLENLVNLAADHLDLGLAHHHTMLGEAVRVDGTLIARANLASQAVGRLRALGPTHLHMIVGQVVLGALPANLASLVPLRVVDGGAIVANLERANQVKVEEDGLLAHRHGAHPENRESLVVVVNGLIRHHGAHQESLASPVVVEEGPRHGAHPANQASLVVVEDGTLGEIPNLENLSLENLNPPKENGPGYLLLLQSLILQSLLPSQSQLVNQQTSL